MTDFPEVPQGWTDQTNMGFAAPGEGIACQKKVKNGVTASIRSRRVGEYADLDDKFEQFEEGMFYLQIRSPRGHSTESLRLRKIVTKYGDRHFDADFAKLVQLAELCISEAHN